MSARLEQYWIELDDCAVRQVSVVAVMPEQAETLTIYTLARILAQAIPTDFPCPVTFAYFFDAYKRHVLP